MSNRIPEFTEEENPIEFETLRIKMLETVKAPYSTGISWPATYTNEGERLPKDDRSFPFEMEFRPTQHFSDEKEFDSNGNQVMWWDQLKSIENGSTVLEAWGLT